MNGLSRRTDAEFEWALRDWLEESVERLPDGPALPAPLRSALISQLTTTPRRRRWAWDRWGESPRRSGRMFAFAALLAAGAIGAGAMLVGVTQRQTRTPTFVVAQDGSGDYLTLTEAVAAADDGDRIEVRPGRYAESVTITDDITITGDGDRASVIFEASPEKPASGDPFAMALVKTDATVSGVTFSGLASGVSVLGGTPTLEGNVWDGVGLAVGGPLSDCPDPRGCAVSLSIDQGSGAVLRASLFLGGMGVSVFGDSDPLIEDNDFRDGPIVWFWDAGDAAILRHNTSSGATFHAAIGVAGPTGMRIEGNTITDPLGFGINVQGEPGTGIDPVITGNVIDGAALGGIEVMSGTRPIIEQNIIRNTETGIRLVSSDATVRSNAITGLAIGLSIFGGAPTVADNTLDSNGTAIREAQASAATITGNSLCGNTTDRLVDNVPSTLPAGNSVCTVAPSMAP